MDKLDLFLIPFIYLFRATLIILSEFTFIFHTPSIIWRELKNTLTWMETPGIHLILFSLSVIPLNVMLNIPLSCAILFWLKVYYSLFKYK